MGIQDFKAKIKILQTHCTEQTFEIEGLQGIILSITRELEGYQDRMLPIQETLKIQDKKIKAQEAENKILVERIAALEAENEILWRQIARLMLGNGMSSEEELRTSEEKDSEVHFLRFKNAQQATTIEENEEKMQGIDKILEQIFSNKSRSQR